MLTETVEKGYCKLCARLQMALVTSMRLKYMALKLLWRVHSFTGGPFMLIFMQAVRLLPCSLIYTQKVNEDLNILYFCIIFTIFKKLKVAAAGVCCLGSCLSCKVLWDPHYAISVAFQPLHFCCDVPRRHCHTDLLAVLLPFFSVIDFEFRTGCMAT